MDFDSRVIDDLYEPITTDNEPGLGEIFFVWHETTYHHERNTRIKHYFTTDAKNQKNSYIITGRN